MTSPENQHNGPPEEGSEEGRFTFTDKRKVDADGTVRPVPASDQGAGPAGRPAPAGAPRGAAPPDPAGAADPEAGTGAPVDPTGAEAPVDPMDAEAAALHESTVNDLENRVASLTDELARERAEYVNSRRRIENTARQEAQRGTERVLESLFPVLDDIHGARTAGDVPEGTPFGAIVTKLEEILASQGLERFGAEGEEFDPEIHEALMHSASEDADTTVVLHVLQPGYRIRERVVRAARVATQGPA